MKQTGITKGFCIVLGNNKGQLAYELAKRSELVIFGVDADEKKVATARRELLATGLYGTRITVDHLDLAVMPYSSYCANLIVSDSGEPVGIPADVARHLKPIGGKFCFKATPQTAAWLTATKLTDEKATVTDTAGWSVLTRSSLPGASSWSHQYGNAANTSSTDDHRIKGGLSVLWYGDPGPGKVVNRHDGAVGPLSVNGRLFVQGEDSVMAYDAYNGRLLWETKNPGAMRIGAPEGTLDVRCDITDPEQVEAAFATVEEERLHRKQKLAGALRIFGRVGFGEGERHLGQSCLDVTLEGAAGDAKALRGFGLGQPLDDV